MEKTYPMALMTAPGKVEFRERKLPRLSSIDVLIRVKASSICGSDLHIFKGKLTAIGSPGKPREETGGAPGM